MKPIPVWTSIQSAPYPRESKSSRRISRAPAGNYTQHENSGILHVDVTHVLADGKMILSGDSSLVEDINENGFEKIYRTSGIRSVQEGGIP